MRFPFDLVFLDRKGYVVYVQENVRPFRFVFPKRGGFSTLEVAVGSIAGSKTAPGDRVSIEE